MKKTIYSLLALTVTATIMMAGCSSESTDTAGGTEEESVEILDEETVSAFPAKYDGCELDATRSDTDGEYMTVYATYTNNNEEPSYALSSFVVKAFQGGAGLEDCSDIDGDEAALIQEVKDGASVEVSYKFKLSNDEEDVEFAVYTPTADEDLLAEDIYSMSED